MPPERPMDEVAARRPPGVVLRVTVVVVVLDAVDPPVVAGAWLSASTPLVPAVRPAPVTLIDDLLYPVPWFRDLSQTVQMVWAGEVEVKRVPENLAGRALWPHDLCHAPQRRSDHRFYEAFQKRDGVAIPVLASAR